MDALVGDHPLLEVAYWISQVAVAVIAGVAAYIAFRQLRSFGLLELGKLMQEPDVRRARGHIYHLMETKAYKDWTEDDKFKASTVCSSFDMMGFMLQKKFSRQRMFIELYGNVVIRTYSALPPYLIELRAPHRNSPKYWQHYTWLYNQVRLRQFRPAITWQVVDFA